MKKNYLFKIFLLLIFSSVLFTNNAKATPSIVAVHPVDDGTNIPTNPGLWILFNTDILVDGAGSYSINCTGPGLCPTTMGFCSAWSTWGPYAYLSYTGSPNETWNVQFDGNCFRDGAFAYHPGYSTATDWNWTLGAGPGCTWQDPCYTPIDDSVANKVDTHFHAKFYTPWDGDQNGLMAVYDSPSTLWRQGTVLGSSEIFGGETDTFTFNPSPELNYNDTYHVNIEALYEQGGAAFLRFTDATEWNFTTRPAWTACSGVLSFNADVIDANIDTYHMTPFDIDEDGDMDFVTHDYAADDLVWYENDGSENFTRNNIDTNYNDVRNFAVADFDGDGDFDIVGASINSTAGLAWYENDGSESFTRNLIDNVGLAYDVEAYDIDSDNDIDLVVPSGSNMYLYVNNGNAGFTRSTLTTTSGTSASEVGDIDGDGDYDIAFTDRNLSDVYWLENDGEESFTRHTVDASFGAAEDVKIADVNNDGDIDLIVAARSVGDIAWYENDGSESFTKRNIDLDLTSVYEIDIGDIDGDGDIDIIAASLTLDDVVIYYNDGSGNFTERFIDSNFNGARGVNFADVDSDGTLDILAASPTDNDIYWYRTEGCIDTTNPTLAIQVPEDNDVGVDRTQDLVLHFSESVFTETGNLTIRRSSDNAAIETVPITDSRIVGNGGSMYVLNHSNLMAAGTEYYVQIDTTAFDDNAGNSYAGITDTTSWSFTTANDCRGVNRFQRNDVDLGTDTFRLVLEDLDDDGDQDIIATDSAADDVVWYQNDGTNNFGLPIIIDAAHDDAKQVIVIDFDKDGDKDIIAAANNHDDIGVYINDGSESFTAYFADISSSNLEHIEVADVDGDGNLDIVSWNNSRIYLYLHDGSFNFIKSEISNAFSSAVHGKIVDMDGDDDFDIVVADSVQSDLEWLENDGSESFTLRTIDLAFSLTAYVIADDFDNDGDIDIAASSPGLDDLAWWENDGSENFTKNTFETNLGNPESIQSVDMDGDGDRDFLVVSTLDNAVTWYENTGSMTFSSRHPVIYGFSGARFALAKDLDLDGDLDVVASSTTADDLVWLDNVGCSDSANPNLVFEVPEDNSVGVIRATNLKLYFDKAVFTETGNLTIRRSSDNVAVETIPITDSRVVGNGTAMIEVNPTNNLVNGVEYYVQIDTTAFDDARGNSYAGITDTTSFSFTCATRCNGDFRWSRTDIDTSRDSYHVTVADLDDDGDLDIIATDHLNSDDVIWYENDGSNNFSAGTVLDTTLSNAREVVVIDMDKDGDKDIVVIAISSEDLVVYENDGSEVFTRLLIDGSINNVNHIAVEDLDGDGFIDIVAFSDTDIRFFQNDGSLNFLESILYNISLNEINAGFIVDLDQDDDMDILFADQGNHDIEWLENDGSMNLTLRTVDLNLNQVNYLDYGDFDNDGDIDIAASSLSLDDVTWYENDGSENFTKNDIDTNFDGPFSIKATDMDGDGDIDFLATASNVDEIVWYENDGAMSFVKRPVYFNLDTVREAIPVDLDRDGDMDVVATSTIDDDIIWMRNDNCVDSTNPTAYYIPVDNSVGVSRSQDLLINFTDLIFTQSGNIDIRRTSDNSVFESIPVGDSRIRGDGMSVVTISPNNIFENGTEYYVQIATTGFDDAAGNSFAGITDTTSWSFTVQAECTGVLSWNADLIDASVDVRDIAIADFDGDGDYDLVATDYALGDVHWYENDGSQNFTKTAIETSISGGYRARAFDFDKDGDEDIVVAFIQADDLAVYINDGSASFTRVTLDVNFDGVADAYFNDLDLDGHMDVVAVGDTEVNWYQNDGLGNFSSLNLFGSLGSGHDMTPIDLDEDGDIDFVLSDAGSTDLRWYENDGSMNFTLNTIDSTYSAGNNIEVVDFDHDGDWDIVSANMNWYENDGSESFTERIYHYGTAAASRIFVEDIDGDGDLDVAATNYNADDVFWLENDGSQNLVRRPIDYNFDGAFPVKVFDIDRDGQMEIIAGSYVSDDLVIYEVENCIDAAAPLVDNFNPLDDSIGVSRITDLEIDFNDIVYTNTGNLTIRRSSDNFTVETIPITDSRITGNGFQLININPNAVLDVNTEYYVQIDSTAITDKAGNAYAGIADTTSWSFTTVPSSCSGTVNFGNGETIDSGFTMNAVFDVGDLDSDGDDDIVISDITTSDIHWYENDGTGSFTQRTISTSIRTYDIEIIDFDDDGDMDIVADTANADDVIVYYNDGSESFTEDIIYTLAFDVASFDAIDFDGDLRTDVVYYGDDEVDILHNDGNGNFYSLPADDATNVEKQIIAVDLNQDGDMDMIALDFQTIYWFRNDGADNFTRVTLANAIDIGASSNIYVQDVDNDGDLDIGNNRGYYENDGSNSFGTFRTVNSAYASSRTIAQDIDGDGDTDFFFSSAVRTDFYRNDGAFSYTATSIDGTYGGEMELGDFDSDGVQDLVIIDTNRLIWYPTQGCTLAPSVPPEIITLIPPDNGTNIDVDTSLNMVFDQLVETQTGNIEIRQVANGNLIESIPVGAVNVTGNGTNIISVNPSVTFPYSTDLYVIVPATAFDSVNNGDDFAGLTAATQWNFQTSAEPGWYGCDFHNRVKLQVQALNVNGDQTNFPVFVDLNDLAGTGLFADVDANGADLRVTEIDGTTELPIEVVDIDTGANTGEIHFRADNLSGSQNTTFFLYYDNPDAQLYANGDTYGSDNVWSNNYVGVWHMNDDPNGDVALSMNDSSSSNNDGSPSGVMTTADLITGSVGNAIDFDGANDHISLGVSNLPANNANQTWTAWINFDDTTTRQEIITLPRDDTGGAGSSLSYEIISNNLNAETWGGGDLVSIPTTVTGVWNYYSYTWDGTTNLFYKDDVLVDTSTSAHGTQTPTVAYLGTFSSAFPLHFDGRLDEVRIATAVRSAAWIETEYNNQSSSSTFYTAEAATNYPLSQARVLHFSPPNNAYMVNRQQGLLVIFDRNMQKGTGNVRIRRYSDNAILRTVDVTGSEVTVTNNVVNIRNFGTLNSNDRERLYVDIDAGALEEQGSGLDYECIQDRDQWSFYSVKHANTGF